MIFRIAIVGLLALLCPLIGAYSSGTTTGSVDYSVVQVVDDPVCSWDDNGYLDVYYKIASPKALTDIPVTITVFDNNGLEVTHAYQKIPTIAAWQTMLVMYPFANMPARTEDSSTGYYSATVKVRV